MGLQTSSSVGIAFSSAFDAMLAPQHTPLPWKESFPLLVFYENIQLWLIFNLLKIMFRNLTQRKKKKKGDLLIHFWKFREFCNLKKSTIWTPGICFTQKKKKSQVSQDTVGGESGSTRRSNADLVNSQSDTFSQTEKNYFQMNSGTACVTQIANDAYPQQMRLCRSRILKVRFLLEVKIKVEKQKMRSQI